MASDRPTLANLGITPDIARALEATGLVIVARIPTPFMLDQAWAAAQAEKADEVWQEMIDACEAERAGFSLIR